MSKRCWKRSRRSRKSTDSPFKVATISAGIYRGLLKNRTRTNKVGPCGPVEGLTVEGVDRAIDVVAQMGAEPWVILILSLNLC